MGAMGPTTRNDCCHVYRQPWFGNGRYLHYGRHCTEVSVMSYLPKHIFGRYHFCEGPTTPLQVIWHAVRTVQTERSWSQDLIASFAVHGQHKSICAAAHTEVIVKRGTSATVHGRHKSICAAAHTQVIVKRTILNDLCRLRLGTL